MAWNAYEESTCGVDSWHASRRRRQFVQLDDPSSSIAKRNQKYTPPREPDAVLLRLSIKVLRGSSIAAKVSKAFMTRTRCLLLVFSISLISGCSVVSAARSLKAVRHPQDGGETSRRLEPARTDGDELQSEDEGESILSDDEERTPTGLFSGFRSMVGWKSKGEKATVKAADGVLQRAKSTKDGDWQVEKAKTAKFWNREPMSLRYAKWYKDPVIIAIVTAMILLVLAMVKLWPEYH